MLTLDSYQTSPEHRFHDLATLCEETEKLGKRAIALGLISSLTVHLFPDCWQFLLSQGQESELLTPQEAYLRLKKLVEQVQ